MLSGAYAVQVFHLPSSEQPLVVRPVRRQEWPRWAYLMRQHHYLGFERIVGEALCYVASRGAHWVALLGWGSAALKCAPRDQWIGWDRALQFRRLQLIANNVRFLILPDCHEPNLASRLLALNLKRLSKDWQRYLAILAAGGDLRGCRPVCRHLLPRGGLAAGGHHPRFCQKQRRYCIMASPSWCSCAPGDQCGFTLDSPFLPPLPGNERRALHD